ncbi:MAG: cytochrome c biogenesis protein CcsA [Thermoanaerobaculia bacterium]|jgi:heme exporter protein C|nr:cytochrome c biogenesis protein CcsA [Thermoanaerobaculia bacterium]
MGEVQRIMYVHVPTAWNALLCFTCAFVAAIGSLWTGRERWDATLVAASEAGIVLNGLLLVQGSLWGRATWGVWWDWDVRLTTSLILLLLFIGVLSLRSFAAGTERKASLTAVAAIVAYVDVPLVYFCVRWWRSLHQIQSTPATVDPAMVLPLRLNAFGLLFAAIWFIVRRARLELARRRASETALPDRIERIEVGHA